jgi:hypothetical protein
MPTILDEIITILKRLEKSGRYDDMRDILALAQSMEPNPNKTSWEKP